MRWEKAWFKAIGAKEEKYKKSFGIILLPWPVHYAIITNCKSLL